MVSPSDLSCGLIPRIQSGYSLLCNSVILYQCHAGFRLLGSSSISCDPDRAQWSSPPPTCQGTENTSKLYGLTRVLNLDKNNFYTFTVAFFFGGKKKTFFPSDSVSPYPSNVFADINECEELSSLCPQHLECSNTAGSFICSGGFRTI